MALPPVPLKQQQRALITRLAELVDTEGEMAFLQPWIGKGRARNAVSGEPYHGYNIFFLMFSEWLRPHEGPPLYLTKHQIEERGGHLKADAQPIAVLYAGIYRPKQPAAAPGAQLPALTPEAAPAAPAVPAPLAPAPASSGEAPLPARFFAINSLVYHVADTSGVKLPKKTLALIENHTARSPWTEQEQCDRLRATLETANLCPVRYGGERAFYSRRADYIQIPDLNSFRSDLDHLITLAHESCHATGHESRLKRPTITKDERTDEDRGIEEIVAVVGSLLLCEKNGVQPPEAMLRSWASYLQGWGFAELLREKPELFARALVWADLAHLYISEPAKRPDYVRLRRASNQIQLDFAEDRVVPPVAPLPAEVAALAAPAAPTGSEVAGP
jgi:antirestriction protein ArdC